MPKKLVDAETRRRRVLDDRQRTIGVDAEGLDRQVQEKRTRQEEQQRARREEEAVWASSWELVTERAERKAEAIRQRQLTYRMELWEQIEAKQKEARAGASDTSDASDAQAAAGFDAGFGQSHR